MEMLKIKKKGRGYNQKLNNQLKINVVHTYNSSLLHEKHRENQIMKLTNNNNHTTY